MSLFGLIGTVISGVGSFISSVGQASGSAALVNLGSSIGSFGETVSSWGQPTSGGESSGESSQSSDQAQMAGGSAPAETVKTAKPITPPDIAETQPYNLIDEIGLEAYKALNATPLKMPTYSEYRYDERFQEAQLVLKTMGIGQYTTWEQWAARFAWWQWAEDDPVLLEAVKEWWVDRGQADYIARDAALMARFEATERERQAAEAADGRIVGGARYKRRPDDSKQQEGGGVLDEAGQQQNFRNAPTSASTGSIWANNVFSGNYVPGHYTLLTGEDLNYVALRLGIPVSYLERMNPDWQIGQSEIEVPIPGFTFNTVQDVTMRQYIDRDIRYETRTLYLGSTYLNAYRSSHSAYYSGLDVWWNNLSPTEQRIEMALMGSMGVVNDQFTQAPFDHIQEHDFSFVSNYIDEHKSDIVAISQEFGANPDLLAGILMSEMLFDYGKSDATQDDMLRSRWEWRVADPFVRFGDWWRHGGNDGASIFEAPGYSNVHFTESARYNPTLQMAYVHLVEQEGINNPWDSAEGHPEINLENRSDWPSGIEILADDPIWDIRAAAMVTRYYADQYSDKFGIAVVDYTVEDNASIFAAYRTGSILSTRVPDSRNWLGFNAQLALPVMEYTEQIFPATIGE